ncbi:hypothetical protein [Novosphingobium sp. BW1]|uniref:hypothetical protein n=1 Tax=Novosphingobium sp. BW1 TaxID=2592621 RepID=UPI0011DE60FC|nr:hypothetical protein [Novosphingobium sp. BW1]TYC85098.1 hypothetical protein FMM79_18585 [Novosphingobium sp. BW1]
MKLKTAILALGAATALVAPMAAQAGTSASASVGKVSSLSGVGVRQSAPVEKKRQAEAGVIVLGVLAGAAAVYGIVELVDDGDDDSVSNGV